jgi:hypothetical protein
VKLKSSETIQLPRLFRGVRRAIIKNQIQDLDPYAQGTGKQGQQRLFEAAQNTCA